MYLQPRDVLRLSVNRQSSVFCLCSSLQIFSITENMCMTSVRSTRVCKEPLVTLSIGLVLIKYMFYQDIVVCLPFLRHF